jgi:hypothetical protein
MAAFGCTLAWQAAVFYPMSRGHRPGHHEPAEETLAIIAMQQFERLEAVLRNRKQQKASGAVSAGDAITPDVLITTVRTGKFRVSASATLSTSATITTLTAIGSEPLTPQWTGVGVFELDSGALPGQVLRVRWQTGAAAVVSSAALLVEELP